MNKQKGHTQIRTRSTTFAESYASIYTLWPIINLSIIDFKTLSGVKPDRRGLGPLMLPLHHKVSY